MAFAKTELNWVTVNPAGLDKDSHKLFDAIGQARDTFKEHMVKMARKQGALSETETLVIAHKAWGFSMAKVAIKAGSKAGQKADPKAMFANLG